MGAYLDVYFNFSIFFFFYVHEMQSFGNLKIMLKAGKVSCEKWHFFFIVRLYV